MCVWSRFLSTDMPVFTVHVDLNSRLQRCDVHAGHRPPPSQTNLWLEPTSVLDHLRIHADNNTFPTSREQLCSLQ